MANKIVVSFSHRYDDSIDWEDDYNISPYITIESPEYDIAAQLFPDEVVIPMNKIKVYYDYPLSIPATFEFKADQEAGFTRAELARKICRGYQKIYQEEDAAVGDPGHRAQSEGPYGIFGHDIGDLVLRTVKQIDVNLFSLEVDS